jgi:hypothetical protein
VEESQSNKITFDAGERIAGCQGLVAASCPRKWGNALKQPDDRGSLKRAANIYANARKLPLMSLSASAGIWGSPKCLHILLFIA